MAYGCSDSGDCLFGKKKLQWGQQGTTGDIWDKDDIWCFKAASLFLEKKKGSAVCSGYFVCLICLHSHLSHAKSIFFKHSNYLYLSHFVFLLLFFKTIHVRDEFDTLRLMLNKAGTPARLQVQCIMTLFLIICITTKPFVVRCNSQPTAWAPVELLHIQLLDSSNFHFLQSLKL